MAELDEEVAKALEACKTNMERFTESLNGFQNGVKELKSKSDKITLSKRRARRRKNPES